KWRAESVRRRCQLQERGGHRGSHVPCDSRRTTETRATVGSLDCTLAKEEDEMSKIYLAMLTLCAMLPAAVAQTPAPAAPAPMMPPSLPPAFVVDLMAAQGSAAFGAQWKTMEAKIINTKPIPVFFFKQKTAYEIEPHAGESGFDDSKWPTIEAKDLAARRSGGHVAFIWYRTNLTIPAKVGDF